MMATRRHENKLWRIGFNHIVGIDEVGRGSLAGPVTVGAVLMTAANERVAGVKDSKQLTAALRGQLCPHIERQSAGAAIGMATVEEINTHGIMWGIQQAMLRAIEAFSHVDIVLLDGSFSDDFLSAFDIPVKCIVKGDEHVYSIAAASIIAKVARDTHMQQLATSFPDYGWERNVGYGTREHREAIAKHGICEHHRLGFCKNITRERL